MNRKKSVFVSAIILLGAIPSSATIDSGMVLMTTLEGETNRGKLELIYLSTMDTVVLQDGGARDGCFSPDGQKVVYKAETGDEWGTMSLYAINIDGTGRTRLTTDEVEGSGPNWCTDGFIYWGGPGEPFVERIPENGGRKETVWEAWDDTRYPGMDGTWVTDNLGGLSVSLDGTRTASTVLRYNSETGGSSLSYAQLNIDLTTGEAVSYAQPCQGSVSPDGSRISVSTYGHTVYRIVPWNTPFQEWSFGDTYSGCEAEGTEYDLGGSSAFTCPGFEDAMLLGPDLRDRYGFPDGFSNIPVVGSPHWSRTDGDIFLFWISSSPGGEANGAWLRRISTVEYLKVGEGVNCRPDDYFATEFRTLAPYTLTPTSVQFSCEPGGVLPAAKTVTLRSHSDMASAPAIAGVPVWLQVAAAANGSREYTLSNELVSASMPGTGDYSATITVTPAASASPLTYEVALSVGEAPVGPIVIHEPAGGETFQVGDTLHILYSAESPPLSGTIVSLSLDAGDYYTRLHSGEAWDVGENATLDFVITPELLGSSSSSDDCIIKISAYPSGYETYTQQFTISANTPVRKQTGRPENGAVSLKASLVHDAAVPTLYVTAPQAGSMRLVDIRGRTARQFSVERGFQALPAESLRPGRYLLSFVGRNGNRENVVVTRH